METYDFKHIIKNLYSNGKMITIRKPPMWNIWPLYKKINYYGTQLTQLNGIFADKLIAKDIVNMLIPPEDLRTAGVVKILKNPIDISIDDICCNCILKSTHGCGWNIDLGKVKTINEIIPYLISWNRPYKIERTQRHYRYIMPRFFIEEKITDKIKGITSEAFVYMVRCIYGKPQSIGVLDKKDGINSLYDTNWKKIVQDKYIIEKPKKLDTMLKISEQLSAIFEFVRIDFYIGEDDELYFSEFTFTPAGGTRVFSDKVEMELGKMWV